MSEFFTNAENFFPIDGGGSSTVEVIRERFLPGTPGIILQSTDVVRVTTTEASTLAVRASFLEVDGDEETGDVTVTPITTPATTTIVASPTLVPIRCINSMVLANTHATLQNTLTIEHFDGTDACRLWKGMLLPGESVVYTPRGWLRLSAGGRPVSSSGRRTPATQVQSTAGPGTWTKPTTWTATHVLVLMWGGGGGGGGGAAALAGTAACGGAGAGGGAFVAAEFEAADLPDTVDFFVGAGGYGGDGATSGTGGRGGTGGNTRFFTVLAYGGGPGGEGPANAGPNSGGGGGGSGSVGVFAYGGSPGVISLSGVNAGQGASGAPRAVLDIPCAERGGAGGGAHLGNFTDSSAGGSSLFGGGAGGTGGSHTTAPAVVAGTDGGSSNTYTRGGGGAVGAGGAVPVAGTAGTAGNSTRGGSGGGGGGSSATAGVGGARGGDGGGWGGAGGGGGAGMAGGGAGGAGGNGGAGAIVILTF